MKVGIERLDLYAGRWALSIDDLVRASDIPVHLVQLPDVVRVILQGQLLKPAGRGLLRGLECRTRIRSEVPAMVCCSDLQAQGLLCSPCAWEARPARHLKAKRADVHSLAADVYHQNSRLSDWTLWHDSRQVQQMAARQPAPTERAAAAS